MKIGVPSGIGDISWLVSKLINAPEWPNIELIVADGWPFRADDYLKMLGKCKNDRKSNYGSFRFDDIVVFEKMNPYHNWSDITKRGFGVEYMQPNHHLEMGRPLDDYLPDLKTDYHYKLDIPVPDCKLNGSKWIGISCASYRGAHAWHTWEEEQWTDLLTLLAKDDYKFVFMGGRWDDLTDSVAAYFPSNAGHINMIGKTTFSQACAIHKMLPFYIGFSSGLGIIRTVMSLPTMMLWPEHQQPLSFSWADPEDIDSKKYLPFPYTKPKIIYNQFKAQEELYG
jgi:hypothetical protein